MKTHLIKLMVLGVMLVGLPMASQAANSDAAIAASLSMGIVNATSVSFHHALVTSKSTAEAQAAAAATFKARALVLVNNSTGSGSEALSGQALAKALSEVLSIGRGYLTNEAAADIVAAIKAANAKVYAAMRTEGSGISNIASFFPVNQQQENETYTPPGSGTTSINVAATTSVSDGQVK